MRLGDLDVEAYLNDPERKQAFVTPMFDVIAPRYDAFTRVFSFGMDAGWKRKAVRVAIAAAPNAQQALDVACGTGDFCVALAEALPQLRVLGVDASPRMVALARDRLHPNGAHHCFSRIQVEVGDMMRLDIADASIDLMTAGYGVRNVPNAAIAVREMARVLKPGAALVTLDFYRPQNTVWRKILLSYLSAAGNVVGWLWHRDPVVYGYIAKSIEHFMSWQAFSALLAREGFSVQQVQRFLGGGIVLHTAIRR